MQGGTPRPRPKLRGLLWNRYALVVAVVLVAAAVPSAMAAFRTANGSAMLRLAAGPGRSAQGGQPPVAKQHVGVAHRDNLPKPVKLSKPTELHLKKAASAVFDVRTLKSTVIKRERPELQQPGYGREQDAGTAYSASPNRATKALLSPAPAPDTTFDGLDFASWGAGHPPDTNGDVGPNYYIQTVNTSIGIYDKPNGNRVAAFTFNAFMSQGHFGNLCDTDNFGDPVVLYDSFEDRWFITDFAFKLDAQGNVVNPPGAFQCFAVSKTGDPVSGGWNFYSIAAPGALNDYPKFGIWPDGIYMSANLFSYAGRSFVSSHVWALNKQQMYAGAPTVQVVDFAAPPSEFTLLPANARLQTGTPPAGSPNYFAVVWQFLNAVSVYKFHVDWDKISTSTFTGPFVSTDTNWWEQYNRGTQANPITNTPTPANANDTLYPRLMVQNQYTNIGGVESLWDSHTVGAGNPGATNVTSSQSAVRFYQTKVTGGTVEAAPTQAWTYSPDTSLFRYMPSVAADRVGDMAIGYTSSNSTTNPALKYAGRLAGDAPNTITQDEQTLLQGTGAQSGNCGSSTCTRWGDYSAMSLDPNGCTFWYTNEYYAVNGLNDLTRIGSFHYPSCSTVGNGTLSGAVTDGTNPVAGATITLGSRTTTTNASGAYSFTVPAGTYASLTADKAGFNQDSASTIAVPNGGTATRNFTLSTSPQSGCFTDNSQSTFQRGAPTNCDLVSSPDNVVLANPDNTDAKNSDVSPTGFTFTNTSWAGQTFTPTVTGQLKRVDVELFCSVCNANSPNVTLSIRATTGTTPVPTGADLATATLPGFNDGGAGGLKTFTLGTPLSVTAGTRYAFIFRLASSISSGAVAYTCSCVTTGFSNTNPYADGQRVTSTTSGSAWTADTTVGGRDLNFVTYINPGFASSGTFVSSLKDASPAAGRTPNWTTLSFTATKPAGTDVKFQVAGSNNQNGPFNYLGPDGTTGTFYTTSGASVSQFNGLRYLRYKAILSTTNGAVTPSLSSVQVCFNDASPSATNLAVDAATGPYGGATSLSASLTSGGNPVSGKTISFTLNGSSAGSADTDGSGVATLAGVSVAGIAAGSYPTGVGATFAGDAQYQTSSGSAALTVNATAPGAPSGVSASAGDGQADVSWSPPASDGGSAVTGYVVTPYVGSTAQAPKLVGNVTSTTVTGLTNGTAYTFTVAAVNAVGTGPESAASNAVTPQAASVKHVVADFNGDGKTDVSIFRPSTGRWYIRNQFETSYGSSGDVPVPGDYNGDGSSDIAIFRPSNGRWYIRGQFEASWGSSTDIPVPGDYNGDGKTDIAIYRPSIGRWYIRGQYETSYGSNGDIPVPGDYNGDGQTDIAIYRPSTGRWYIRNQSEASWGSSTDIPVPGDYNGDGKTDIAIYRPSIGRWYIRGQYETSYGSNGDIPVPGDYNADGQTDIAIYRPSTGRWYIRNQSEASWGTSTDIPLPLPNAIYRTYFTTALAFQDTDVRR